VLEHKSIININTIQYGKVSVHLDEILSDRKLSKTKLAQLANTNYKNIKRLCDRDVQRVDLDILARICYVLDCNVSDVIRYDTSKTGD